MKILVAFTLLVLATHVVSSAQQPAAALLISGATVIDVQTGASVKDRSILIEGSQIVRVGASGDVQAPPGAQAIDARGKWIIPGLMDLHAHVDSSTALLPLYLANGVTTIRDPSSNVTTSRLTRQQLQSGKAVGPTLFFAGTMLDGLPPVWPQAILADTPERARSAVDFLAAQGVDAIKVYNNLSEASLVAILAQARVRQLPVIGHVPRAITITRAIELGLLHLEHIRITARELLPAADADKIDFLPLARRETLLWDRVDLASPKIKQLIDLMVAKRVFLDPTLTIDYALFGQNVAALAEEPENQHLPPATLARFRREPLPDLMKVPPELKEMARNGFRKRLEFIGMCNRAGVRLVTGTDGIGLGKLLAGFAVHHELGFLVEAGLTPLQALRASTITAAQALGRERELGSIEHGKAADLVILDADPLQTIGNARRIFRVIKGGQVHQPADLLQSVRRQTS